MAPDNRSRLLTEYQQRFAEMGFGVQLVAPSPGIPLETLVVRFDKLGGQPYVDLQLSFLPRLPESPDPDPLLILQMFAELHDHVVSDAVDELAQLAAAINLYLPLGAFGVVAERRVLFYKYTSLVDSRLAAEQRLEHLDRQLALILHLLNIFVPLLEEVYAARLLLPDALVIVDQIALGEVR